MKKLLQTKYMTMLCFLSLLTIMFWQGIPQVYKGFENGVNDFQNTGMVNFSTVEAVYNDNFTDKSFFITLNGAYQRLMGARIVNERYRLDNGHLTYIIGEYDMEQLAGNTVEFRDALAAMDIPMVYVSAPFKVHQTDKQLPVGVEDHSNENADRFLAYLYQENVTVLDLRETITEQGLDHYSLFYKTDHHWKAETGLWAAGEIANFLSAQDESFRVEETLLDPSSYSYEVHEGIFLGSAGRRVGHLYAGMDDFTIVTPAFETDLSLSAQYGTDLRKGSFSDVFIVRENLYPEDPIISNMYSTYCGYGFSQVTIQNHNTASETPCTPKKILLIRDSFSDVTLPFLSMGYAQLDALDLRTFNGNLMEYIEECCPDMVLVLYNPGAYENNNLVMFDFLDSHGNGNL